MRRLGLDKVWWLVTPGNPLKNAGALPRVGERMRAAAVVAAHPRIVVSGVEARLGTRHTADLIRFLKQRAANTRFVWIMGSDNLAAFHRWERWREIAVSVPIAIVNRPALLARAVAAPFAQVFSKNRVDEQDARTLADRSPPAWIFLTGPRSHASSTEIRHSARS
jgi:nicotinate-nucleotide adenylyltransferase